MANAVEPTQTSLTAKDLYTELGVNYRYFLTWRQLIFGGYLTVIAALAAASGWLLKEAGRFLWLAAAAGLLLTAVFWIIERRNREIYRACVKSGAAYEVAIGNYGVYQTFDQPPKGLTQSFALDLLFLVSAAGFFAALVILFACPHVLLGT